MKQDSFDGFLICSGRSKKQINHFKRMFAQDNLSGISKSDYYLQMRKVNNRIDMYSLDVYIHKILRGHFAVALVDTVLISIEEYRLINERAEKMFREDSMYGIKDYEGLDRVNNSLITGWGDYERYPTVPNKAANLWYKLARSQFFYNGNKRTALLSSIIFLRENLYCFDASNGNEMYDISMGAARNEITPNKIEKYILAHISFDYKGMAAIIQNKPYEIEQKIDYDPKI